MRPQVLNVAGDSFQSFGARIDTVPDINSRWHCHSALELIYFKKGNGTQYIGDNIKSFKDGDVVLVGKNLPHYWRFSPINCVDSNSQVEVYVIHFNEDFWGKDIISLPEFQEIKKLLELSKLGLQISGRNQRKITNLISSIVRAKGARKISLLIDCLNEISANKNLKNIATPGFLFDLPRIEKERLRTIYEYTTRNYKNNIDLKEISEVARLSPNSFCRFFKTTCKKTYSQFLSEVRVGQACKMLIEDRFSVKEICYESGFQNFTSFHRTFRKITGKSPLVYQRAFD
ncbi:AraC family transcriptional regulator [Pedobacter sp. MC2016-05]|uniref:AraC family transcriptional regulator n=1 Tax=Pedobacter sp. MC2016-05 TaxID=2994474 RepID=UPI0022460032|nr:AraC family transcriptional regulator [Pedobacter sp. MC2016-05]MCX2475313.1 AraC family transcriptional regulator [Pedobacter sp. MC2016-05]